MDDLSTRNNPPHSEEMPSPVGRGTKRGMRTGYTTGACATAATRAALLALFNGQAPVTVTILLPVGVKATFAVHSCEHHMDGSITASVIKDAGDDPDVTHGAQLCSTVSWLSTPAIQIDGGIGVGRVTKPGLGLEVGSAAINQVPRVMIEGVIRELLAEHGEIRGVAVTISVPDGPLAAWDERVAIIPASHALRQTGSGDLRQMLQLFDTVVLLKVNTVFDALLDILEESHLAQHAVFVRRCSTDREEIVYDLAHLRQQKLDYFSLVIVRNPYATSNS